MARLFHSSPAYRAKQSEITRTNWELGKFNFLLRKVHRICARNGCEEEFDVVPHDPKKYCSRRCAVIANNTGRKMSEGVKKKISLSLTGMPNPLKGIFKIPRIEISCSNPKCEKRFSNEGWKKRRFCSNQCAMSVIGGRPTSPKASKGKNGIRKDISPTINFYSRWEANIARLYSYLKIRWEYAPRSFDIGEQKYTPDFYLPDSDTFVEVKNFWWAYSKIRDEKFRLRYPDVRLDVLLKDEYLELEKKYGHLIPNWEYKNSSPKNDAMHSPPDSV